MKHIWVSVFLLFLTASGWASPGHFGPLGYHSIDFSPQFWSELNPDYKLRGKVSEVLTFAEIETVYIIRCYMHVLNDAHIDRTIASSIPAAHEFSVGPVPEKFLMYLKAPLLTVLFQTNKGKVGLLTIYAGVTILEMDSRYGMILTEDK